MHILHKMSTIGKFAFLLDNKTFSDRILSICYPSIDEESAEEWKRMYVNSGILAAESAVFRVMFSSSFKEGSENTTFVSAANLLEAKAIVHMVEFIYNGVASMPDGAYTANDWFQLLLVSDRYQVQFICKICLERISSPDLLTIPWCLEKLTLKFIQSATDNETMVKLKEIMRKFVVGYFTNIQATMMTSEWKSLPEELVCAVLANEDVNITSENTMFQALRQWYRDKDVTKYKAEELTKLVKNIRLPLVSYNFLRDIVEKKIPIWFHEHVPIEIQNQVSMALEYHCPNPLRRSMLPEVKSRIGAKEFKQLNYSFIVKDMIAIIKLNKRVISEPIFCNGYAMNIGLRIGDSDLLELIWQIDKDSSGLPDSYFIASKFKVGLVKRDDNTKQIIINSSAIHDWVNNMSCHWFNPISTTLLDSYTIDNSSYLEQDGSMHLWMSVDQFE
jgi:hypothetical protein